MAKAHLSIALARLDQGRLEDMSLHLEEARKLVGELASEAEAAG